jgi:hypothetical protein
MVYNITEYINNIKDPAFKERLNILLGEFGKTMTHDDVTTIANALIGNFVPEHNSTELLRGRTREESREESDGEMVNSTPNGFAGTGLANYNPHAYARESSASTMDGRLVYNLEGGRSRSNKKGSNGRENVTRRRRRSYNILRSPRTLSSKKNRSRATRRTRRRSSATSVTAF